MFQKFNSISVLAARKSARIDARKKNKLKQQTEVRPVQRTGRSSKRKGGAVTDTPRRGRRKKDLEKDVPTKIIKPTAKAPAKVAAKPTVKVSVKATTKATPKRTTTTDEAATAGSAAKRAKTTGTPDTTPRRKQEQWIPRKSGEKKNKSSPIQFDYGVPSPIETERESIDDEDSPNHAKTAQRVVIAETKQGQSIRIQLDPPKAFTFKSEQARKLWEAATKERADLIKGLIENRDFVPDWLKRQLEGSLEFTASQTRSIFNEDKSRRTQGMLEWLKLEGKALDLDAEVKLSLNKEFAATNLERCVDCLEKLLQLPVDPLTLKKYPGLAMTPCLLQTYRGALTKWSLPSPEKELFCSKREIVWTKAKALQRKYMELFGIEDDTKYAEVFEQRLQVFQNSVSNLTEEEIGLLVHDPSAKNVGRRKVASN